MSNSKRKLIRAYIKSYKCDDCGARMRDSGIVSHSPTCPVRIGAIDEGFNVRQAWAKVAEDHQIVILPEFPEKPTHYQTVRDGSISKAFRERFKVEFTSGIIPFCPHITRPPRSPERYYWNLSENRLVCGPCYGAHILRIMDTREDRICDNCRDYFPDGFCYAEELDVGPCIWVSVGLCDDCKAIETGIA